MSKKKVVLAVGGTGGHLFPAQGFARQLLKENKGIQLLFAGQGLSTNAYFDKEQFSFYDVHSVTPFRGSFLQIFQSIAILCKGIVASMKLLSREKPNLVVGFGSFHAFPILCAAWMKRIPIILFESNAVPGKVIRVFSKRALFTGVYIADAKKHLRGKTIDVEIPTLSSATLPALSKEEAKRQLSLDPFLPVVLVFGGSQGAQQINQVVIEMLPLLKEKGEAFQLIQFTGSEAMAEELQKRCQRLEIPCYVKKFEKEMRLAWSAADLVICRAGAITLSELLHYEVPGIVIPYPAASDKHQLKNALFLEKTVKGGIHLTQCALKSELLAETVYSLLHSDSLKKSTLQKAIRCFNAKREKMSLGTLVTRVLEEQSMQRRDYTGEHFHFIGIGGIGMSALATLLLERGAQVTGSDVASSPRLEQLKAQGATISIGHSAAHLQSPTAVVFSTAVTGENPEIMEAQARAIPFLHRSELLRQLMQGYKALLVTGTHGKTTTSSLLVHLLVHAGYDPSYAVGGMIRSLESNGGSGSGAYFVAEADESDGSFLRSHPFGAIITNIDNDHLDYWKTMETLIAGFSQFATSVSSHEHLFWCGDDDQLRALKLRGFSYGFDESNDLWIKNFTQAGWQNRFDCSFESCDYSEIEIPLVGAHNVLNAAAVFGMGLKLGISEENIRSALRAFKGVGRRAEWQGERRGIAIFDDYAHHPSEIFATLRAIKQAVNKRRVVVAFQPHRYTRTRDCMNEFPAAFESADLLILTDIYAASETPIEGVTHLTLLETIREGSALDVRYTPRSELSSHLAALLQEGDVLVTMGAGDITHVGKEVLALL